MEHEAALRSLHERFDPEERLACPVCLHTQREAGIFEFINGPGGQPVGIDRYHLRMHDGEIERRSLENGAWEPASGVVFCVRCAADNEPSEFDLNRRGMQIE